MIRAQRLTPCCLKLGRLPSYNNPSATVVVRSVFAMARKKAQAVAGMAPAALMRTSQLLEILVDVGTLNEDTQRNKLLKYGN
eukprot:6479706-Amphidinium_carterae.1